MKSLVVILFAAMTGLTLVGSTFAANAATPPRADTATAAPDASKAAGTKAEKKHVRHHKAAGKSHMKAGKKEEKKM